MVSGSVMTSGLMVGPTATAGSENLEDLEDLYLDWH